MSRIRRAGNILPFQPIGLRLGKSWFDPWAYRREYPDVAEAGIEPWRHFVRHGYLEGRRPSPVFDAAWYLERYPDVAEAQVEPWRHFITTGLREGRSPSNRFNVHWYRTRHPDTGDNPWADYRTHLGGSIRRPVPHFDPVRYRANHMSADEAAVDPWVHYLYVGAERGIAASPLFHAGWYRETYFGGTGTDLQMWLDYVANCLPGGRRPSPVVSLDWYAGRYHALIPPGTDPADHYLDEGLTEDLWPSAMFDPAWYRRTYDVSSGTTALDHFHAVGYQEQLQTAPTFDAKWYRSSAPELEDHDPFEHFDRLGLMEGRPGSSQQIEIWSRLASDNRISQPTASVVLHDQAGKRTVSTASELRDIIDQADLVTLDVWDTLITRPWPADSAKYHVAGIMLPCLEELGYAGDTAQLVAMRGKAEFDLASRQIGADGEPTGEYTAEEAWRGVLEEVLHDAYRDHAVGLIDKAVHAEEAWEISFVQPVGLGVAALSLARAAGKQVVLVSDYYLGEPTLRRILFAAGIDTTGLAVEVSSDHGASKRRGGLLRMIRERLGHSASAHLHVGDSHGSDVLPQIQTGGVALQISVLDPSRPHPGGLTPDMLHRSFLAPYSLMPPPQSAASPADSGWSRLAGSSARQAIRRSAPPYAVIPTLLVDDALRLADERGATKVFYLSREGALLSRVHDAVAATLRSDVGAQHLRVSRLALFLASMRSFSFDELMRMFRMYPHMTPRALFTSLGVSGPSKGLLAVLAGRLGFGWDVPVDWVSERERAEELITCQPIQAIMAHEQAQSREGLLAYLESVEFFDGPTVVCDLGWRGTLQDMLVAATGYDLHGQYLALLPFLNAQPERSTKRASILDANLGEDPSWIENHVSAVERFCTGPVPTTTGYTTDGRPVELSDMSFAIAGATSLLEQLHDTVVESAPEWVRRSRSASFGVAAMRASAMAATRTLIENPSLPLVLPLATQSHDETFGEGNALALGRLRRSWPAGADGLERFLNL